MIGRGGWLSPSFIACHADAGEAVCPSLHCAAKVAARDRRCRACLGDGNYETQWGSEGTGDGEFISADDIALSDTGQVYVTTKTWPVAVQGQELSSKGMQMWRALTT